MSRKLNNPNGRYGDWDLKVREGYRVVRKWPGILTVEKIEGE